MKLEINGISKSFGEKRVLNNISLEASGGMAMGLLGRNGAGKTTTIRIIMGLFPPNEGSISIDGNQVSKSGVTFGYLPEERGMYLKKPILAQLIYLGELKGMKTSEAEKSALKWLERVELSGSAKKRLDTLSKGNQQKVQLITAIMHDPDIIILDEPFSGLDPVNAQLLKDIVTEFIKNNKIVFFSSHQMSYVEEFCKNIAIINKGSIVLSGNLSQIKKSYPRDKILLETHNDADGFFNKIKQLTGDIAVKAEMREEKIIVTLKDAGHKKELLNVLVNNSLDIDRFEVIEPTLEEIFVEKAGENV